jgi:hypothetical protein
MAVIKIEPESCVVLNGVVVFDGIASPVDLSLEWNDTETWNDNDIWNETP